MQALDRRRFLLAATAAATSLRGFAQGAAATKLAKLTLHPELDGPLVPANFVGLSYETQQLADPSFFSPSNKALIAQFRALTPSGVLRLGGNTSDVGWWKPTPESTQPPLPANVVLQTPEGEKSPLRLAYSVTSEAVGDNLRAFLDATGWTCLYGINLGTNTPQRAAEEAAYVAKALGAKLEYFQLGNEPDGFASRFRDKAMWNVDAYFKDWLTAAQVIVARVPQAKFGLPDVGWEARWLEPVAEMLAGTKPYLDIAAISHHYYFTGRHRTRTRTSPT